MPPDKPERPRVVITGSTRGLGLCMAREFLARGCSVMVSGREQGSVDAAMAVLRTDCPGADLHGLPCDVRDRAQVQALWDHAARELGGIDHWINNAGIGQPLKPIWDLPPEVIDDIVRTNVIGAFNGARSALRGMMESGHGAIWFVEGHGSTGRIQSGLSAYGASKNAVRYIARALAAEAQGTGILVGALSPGMMVTDFTMKQLDRSRAREWESAKRIFNILADTPETVAAFLVPRILRAGKGGGGRRILIEWLTTAKILARFLTAPLAKRRIIHEEAR